MPPYERISSFYDAVMDDPGPRAERVAGWIERYRPGARSLLELGCGTGSILARLPQVPGRTGLDSSPRMLAIAHEQVPAARLIQGDMSSFSLGERFDVVISVFDSINHLLDFDAWCSMFDAVHRHLLDDGLFLFDVNTVGELLRLGGEPPWVFDFDRGVMIMDVTAVADGVASVLSDWDIRIFERTEGCRFRLHRERIGELAVSLDSITASLADRFELLESESDTGGEPTDESVKAHFAYRRAG